MHPTGWFRSFALIILIAMFCITLAAQGDPAAIQQKLSTQIKLTRTTADRTDIVTAGDVVVIHKPGLLMYAVASPMPPTNTYKGGKITQGWGGFGRDLAIGMSGNGTAADYPHRPFVPDEKCWVTSIQVQKDGVLLQLYSDPYNDVRYYANLKIPFPDKKVVPPADVAFAEVSEVLAVVPPDNSNAPANQGSQSAQNAIPPPAEGATAPPAPMAAIAPPPPPADAPPPTVSIGQTKDQVTAAFGQPVKAANLGAKTIFYYKDMKVTFLNGKVSDVQ